MIRHFPHSSANWVVESPGHNVEIIGDAILLSKCFSVTNYTVYWNRSIWTKCFRELPVKILPTKTVMFLQFLNRRLIAHGTQINCSMVPESTFFEDSTSQLYHLVKNGTFTPFHSKLLSQQFLSPHFRLPKLCGFNSRLFRPSYHRLDQLILLDQVKAVFFKVWVLYLALLFIH